MHVDGFRFDLASIFTRDNEGRINLNDPPIISEITGDSDFAGIRLIAEAWDLASYQLGRSFPGFTCRGGWGRNLATRRRYELAEPQRCRCTWTRAGDF
jgi:glycogen operon protein